MKYDNMITEKIYDILEPLIGSNMAESSIRIQTKKLGISPDSIGNDELSKIADGIKTSLVVFLGTTGAENISDKVRSIHV
jgi:hypothetical protein